MLKQRVITAVVLITVLMISVLINMPWPFSLLTISLMAAAAWEWSRLNKASTVAMVITIVFVVGACTGLAQYWGISMWMLPLDDVIHATKTVHDHQVGGALAGFHVPSFVWWLTLLCWVLGGAFMLHQGLKRWATWHQTARLLLGACLLIAAWLALIEAKHQGLNLLLSIMSLVWTADIGAYFAGRAWGHRKLAISISPGKSWEGALAGGVATQLLAFGWLWFDQQVAVDSPSLYSHLFHGLGLFGMVAAVVFLSALSVVGDLVESLVKRVALVKDSSQLLPGHGGVLDRIDALLPVLPLSMALMSLCHG
jgi:phosphatidate cytidylyltransferase